MHAGAWTYFKVQVNSKKVSKPYSSLDEIED
jgi:hypothetical protein